MSYSDAEKQEFRNKDLRISKLAILKSLIEKLNLEDVYEVQKIIKLADEYIDYVYSERQSERKDTSKRGEVAGQKPDWEQIALGLNLAIPTSQNIKMLNYLISEYNKANKASANPKDILVHIMGKFGQYPTKSESVETILKSLT